MQKWALLTVLLILLLSSGMISAQALTGSIDIVSGTPVPGEGGTVTYSVSLINSSPDDILSDVCIHLKSPNDSARTLVDTRMACASGDTTWMRSRRFVIPEYGLCGTYILIFRWHEDGEEYSDHVTFEKHVDGSVTVQYHDDGFESQLGCSGQGLCELAVRFTPDTYPVQLVNINFAQQGDAGTGADLRIYLDPDATNTGPDGPADYLIEGVGGSPGFYSVTPSEDIIIESGDFYIGALELDGFLGLALDQTNQDSLLDRNWASVNGGKNFDWLINIVGGEPTLYGNLAISATVQTSCGDLVELHANTNHPVRETSYSQRTIGTSSQNVQLRTTALDQAAVSNQQFEEVVPQEFALEQNYPNPFNPSTVISLQLPVRSQISLSIYDISGRLVQRLVDSQLLDASSYEFTWDGRNTAGVSVASGVYVYQLITDQGFTKTRKMLLAK